MGEIRVIGLVMAVGFAVAGCGGGGAEVLECVGSCACVEDTRTCSCMGGTDCTVAGASDVTLTCDGNASCDLACDERCHVSCPGTAGCTAQLGLDSTGECDGTGTCDYTCEGDCAISCTGASSCIVRCAEGATCTIDGCGGGATECGEGVLACRTSCPPAA